MNTQQSVCRILPLCPVCKQEKVDCVRFVFADHTVTFDNLVTSMYVNPMDDHELFVCPALHVFTREGTLLKDIIVTPKVTHNL